jgi:hypothetical protein
MEMTDKTTYELTTKLNIKFLRLFDSDKNAVNSAKRENCIQVDKLIGITDVRKNIWKADKIDKKKRHAVAFSVSESAYQRLRAVFDGTSYRYEFPSFGQFVRHMSYIGLEEVEARLDAGKASEWAELPPPASGGGVILQFPAVK